MALRSASNVRITDFEALGRSTDGGLPEVTSMRSMVVILLGLVRQRDFSNRLTLGVDWPQAVANQLLH